MIERIIQFQNKAQLDNSISLVQIWRELSHDQQCFPIDERMKQQKYDSF